MPVTEYQAWMLVIGMWTTAALVAIVGYVESGATEAALAAALFGIVALVNVGLAVGDLSGEA